MATLQDLLGMLAPQNASAPPPDRSIGESPGGIFASMVPGALRGMLGLPQQAFQASNAMQQGYGYNPGPMLSAAMLPMGGGFAAPVRMGAGEAALGAGPVSLSGAGTNILSDIPRLLRSANSNMDPKTFRELIRQQLLKGKADYEAGLPPPSARTTMSDIEGAVTSGNPLVPAPLSTKERLWQNYANKMHPDEIMTSEPLWGGAAQVSAEKGISESEAFAELANEWWAKMGANRYISPDLAKTFMRIQRGKANGIQSLPDLRS